MEVKNMNNLKEIFEKRFEEVQGTIIQEHALLEALKQVKIKKTKKGEYFKNINAGLDGAIYQKREFGFGGESILSVDYKFKKINGLTEYATYEISLYKVLDGEDINQYKNRPGNIFDRGAYIKNIYVYAISEWESLIEKEIEKAEKYIKIKKASMELLKTQKDRIEGLVNELDLEVEKAEKEYKEIGDFNNLRYVLRGLEF